MSKNVITYGTFDTFHWGHIQILKRCKDLSQNGKLIVALSTDEFNHVKNKKSYHNYETRFSNLSAIKYVDEIIPEIDWNQKVEDIQKYNIDLVVMGDDWKNDSHFELLREYCDIVYLPRTKSISSSQIKSILEDF